MGLGAALVAILPLIGVVATALGEGQADIALSDLTRYALTSLALSAQVAVLTAVFGVTAAWLVVGHDFPGRRWLSWALALPLAAPAFALAYGYADLFDAAGDLRIWMRGTLGVDMPFEMRSLGGAGLILSLAFYPYVYLAMRAALLNQSSQAIEAARMLGASPARAFFQVALPMARPALAAGVALAVMETLADYGAVQFLGVQTLTTGVVRAWFVFGSVEAAARIALPLLAFAAVLMWIERMGRSGADHDGGRGRWRPLILRPLSPIKAALATGFCLMLVGLGLVLPLGWMAHTMIDITPEWPRLIAAARHSVGLAVIAALVTVALAALLALGSACHAGRGHGHRPADPRRRPVAAGARIGRWVRTGYRPVDLCLCRPPDGRRVRADRGRADPRHAIGGAGLAHAGPERDGHGLGGAAAAGAWGPVHGGTRRIRGCDEGAARHPDAAPVQRRYAGGDGRQLCAG